MKDVGSFLLQLAVAGAFVWLLVKGIQVYFNRRADRTGDYGISRLPERDDDPTG